MKKLLFIVTSLTMLTSCASTELYSWGKYDTKSYAFLKNNTEKSTQELLETYEKIITQQNGSRKAVPPGIYADYGFLLLQMNQTEKGRKMLLQEIALYPESKIFIDRILKMTEK